MTAPQGSLRSTPLDGKSSRPSENPGSAAPLRTAWHELLVFSFRFGHGLVSVWNLGDDDQVEIALTDAVVDGASVREGHFLARIDAQFAGQIAPACFSIFSMVNTFVPLKVTTLPR